MTTSLSLQLNHLGRRGRDVADTDNNNSSSSNQGPRLLELTGKTSLDPVTLQGLAEKGLSNLLLKCPHLADFRPKLFVVAELSHEDKDEAWQEDLLLLLSPFVLQDSCQYLLQFLISRHSTHLSHPEALVCSVLPHYGYNVFHALLALINPSSSSAPWLQLFREQCYPCTKPGLVQHLASHYAFFKMLCEFMIKVERHQTRSVYTHLHKYITTLLGYLLILRLRYHFFSS